MFCYDRPIISTLKHDASYCILQVGTGAAIIPSCATDPCDAGVGKGVFPCCGCSEEPGVYDDDDLRTQFFIPNRTDTSDPPCVLEASDLQNPGGDYTVGNCTFVLLEPSCGNGQVWQITCQVTQDGDQDDLCKWGIDGGVFVNCDGNISGNCDTET